MRNLRDITDMEYWNMRALRSYRRKLVYTLGWLNQTDDLLLVE